MQNIKQILKEYGLEEKEISLYLASLSLGETGMSELAKKSGLIRSTAYVISESLGAKGILGSFVTKKGKRFVATRPEILLSRAKKQVEDLESILPELKAVLKTNSDPNIKYYKGYDGYIVALEDSLKKPNITLRHIGSITELHKVYEDYDLKHYVPERIRKNIFIRSLYSSDTNEKLKGRDHSKELREIRYLPPEYPLKTATLIYENKVVITSTKKEMIAIAIESEDIARTEQIKFDFMWDGLGK